MEDKSELVRLEGFVDNLLAKYKQLKETCTAVEKMLEERDAECAKLKEKIAELRSERSVVGERVSGLIERIEQWESEVEAGGVSKQGELEKQQGKLFRDRATEAK